MKTILSVSFISLLLMATPALAPGNGSAKSAKFDQPILIASAGQSAEVQLASVKALALGLQEIHPEKRVTFTDYPNTQVILDHGPGAMLHPPLASSQK